MTSAAAPAIELRALSKSFPGRSGTVHAVRDLDLTIGRGEVVALLGPNGAGKTTTLDIVLGLTDPNSGTARVLGETPRTAVGAGQVSAVLQTGGLLRDLTVLETTSLIASLYAVHAPVADVLRRADLTDLASRKVSKCSGGEQQRLRFALALLPDPELLVLDEPTAGMDVSGRRTFWDAMHAEAAGGRTVVFATHYLEEADRFADRIVLMAGGRVVADGPTDVIRDQAVGRTVSARVEPAGLEAATRRLKALDVVRGVDVERNRLTVTSTDSDAVAKVLLNDLAASDLEVSSGSLESAFIALTQDPRTTEKGTAA